MSTRISWLLIVLCIAFFVRTNRVRHPDQSASSPGPNVELVLAGRYVVGAHDLLPLQSADTGSRMLASVRKAAHTPQDDICVAIIVGELEGAPAAADRLQEIAHTDASSQVSDDARKLAEVYTHGSNTADSAQRQILRQRYGWFADLALSHDLPANDPARREALVPARRALAIMGGAFAVLCLGGVAALALLIVGAVLLKRGRLHRAYRPWDTPSPRFIEGFAAYLASFAVMIVAGSLLVRHTSVRLPLWVSVLVPLATAGFGVAWLHLRGLSSQQLRDALGWHRGRGVLREMGAGFLGYLSGLPLVAAAAMLTVFLARGSSGITHPIVKEFGRGAPTTLLIYLLACVMAPLCEETLFRGVLYHHLRQRLAPVVSALISGLIFAAIHPQGWVAIPVLGSIGVVLALIREWRGSMIASMTAHALNNAVAVTLMVILIS